MRRRKGASSTERPSVSFMRQVFQEKPSGALECNVSLDRRNSLELRSQSVESSRAIWGPLSDILHNVS